jgi:hypothetical protein
MLILVRLGAGGFRWTGFIPDLRCDAGVQHVD